MSAVPVAPPPPAGPALRVISFPALPAEPPDAVTAIPARRAAYQDELPLTWRNERAGAASAAALGSLPALPLDPRVPRPEPHIAHAARLFADVMAGVRPATHLQHCASLDVQQQAARRSRGLPRPHSARRPAALVSTHTMTISGRVVMVAIVFRAASRAHAAALRLEYRHGRWLVTAAESPSPTRN